MIQSKNWLRYVLAVFAVYRLSSLISSEEGPYIGWPKSELQTGIFEAIRIKAGVYRYGPDGKPETAIARGISCPLCTGVYISFIFLFFIFFPSRIGDLFLTWMGFSGGQVLFENATSDDAIKEAIEDVADNMEDT